MQQNDAMYEVFDEFLKRSTWYKIDPAHSIDENEFYRALSKIVEEPGFKVEDLRDHILGKHEDSEDAADYYVRRATTVREYLLAVRTRT
jgi:hypothetical protein